jgi:hypothetical protein
MDTIKPRDEVRVFDTNGSRVGQPEGGWLGIVVKVGRTLAHIDYGDARERIETFRLSDGRRNDDNGRRYFLTLEQIAERERRATAIAVLKKRRIVLDHGHGLTTEQIEALAEVVKTWDSED